MPHLSPLYWIVMPSIILGLIYSQMIFLYFSGPTSFPMITSSSFKFSSWSWF